MFLGESKLTTSHTHIYTLCIKRIRDFGEFWTDLFFLNFNYTQEKLVDILSRKIELLLGVENCGIEKG